AEPTLTMASAEPTRFRYASIPKRPNGTTRNRMKSQRTTRFWANVRNCSSMGIPGCEKGEPLGFALLKLAEWTGLEPATPGVTGRYSNQLNYHSRIVISWWVLRGSNPRHSPCKGDALPAELSTRKSPP